MSKYMLHTGDSAEVLRNFPDECIDLVVTSPPYDAMRDYRGFSFNFERVAQEMQRIVKPGGVVVWVVGDGSAKHSESGTSFRQALHFKDTCGFNLLDTMIYHKTDLAFPKYGHAVYPQAFEYMFVFSKGRPKTFNPIRDRPNKCRGIVMSGTVRQGDGSTKPSRAKGKAVADFGYRSNVWGYSTGRGKSSSDMEAYEHPAIFPEALAKDHILTWSIEGDVVLDPFMGSGTTGKMAVSCGRHFVGVDVDEGYTDLARRRIEKIIPKSC